jgi:hypothetical protein
MSARLSSIRGAVRAGVAAAFCAAALCSAGLSAQAPAASAQGRAESSDSPQDIRDIRGPKYVWPDWLLPAVLAGGVLLALSVYGVWRRRQQRQRPLPPTPLEVALQHLEDIRALMSPANAAEFSVKISAIVRSYIEQRFNVIVTRRTTEEFLSELLEFSHTALASQRALLGKFLHLCDLVKFGGLSLDVQNMESLRQSARTFVLATAQPAEVGEIGEARDSLPAT